MTKHGRTLPGSPEISWRMGTELAARDSLHVMEQFHHNDALLAPHVAAPQDRVPRAGRGIRRRRDTVLMSVPVPAVVGLVEPIATLRVPLEGALDAAGYSVSVGSSLRELDGLELPFAVGLVRERELDDLGAFVAHHPATVVVALYEPDGLLSAAAVRATGVTGVVPRGAAPEVVLLALRAASCGLTVVPDEGTPVAAPVPAAVEQMSEEERAWLRGLATGRTVTALAEGSAYSERELYRKLSRVYQKLGAGGRVEAMLRAERWGLL